MGLNHLRQRLARLGVGKGKLPPEKDRETRSLETLIEGKEWETSVGAFFHREHRYVSGTTHGSNRLSDWLALSSDSVALLADTTGSRVASLDRFVFIDTETTGLGGAGTLAFMVGLGWFNPQGDFEIHQCFLRSPGEEPAMLEILEEMISQNTALITFNGRSFDIPLLASRYIMARRRTYFDRLTHIDLLPFARRLWKRRLPSRSLGALEADILGLKRTEEDVPGSLIPYFYQQYLQTGDAHEMARVFYHNEQDILSMVALAIVLVSAFSSSEQAELPPPDRLSLALWHESREEFAEAEKAYRMAADDAEDELTRHETLTRYAALLKRLGRRQESVPLWEWIADLKLDVQGHEELAKTYEWHSVDLDKALEWTKKGIALAGSWSPGLTRTVKLKELNYRAERLDRKQNKLKSHKGEST
jgi:hypothetical protein